MTAIRNTDFSFTGQTAAYHGKVRDMYTIGDDLMVAVVSDRISAFDVVMPRGIPFKGQVLNGVASHFLNAVGDIVPTWNAATPTPTSPWATNASPFDWRWSSVVLDWACVEAVQSWPSDPVWCAHA